MSANKYSFCPHTFANSNGLSKHMLKCLKKNVKANKQAISLNTVQVRTYSKPIKPIKQNQKISIDSNEYYLNSKTSSKIISFKDIKFRNSLNRNKSNRINSNIDFNNTFASPLVYLMQITFLMNLHLIQLN